MDLSRLSKYPKNELLIQTLSEPSRVDKLKLCLYNFQIAYTKTVIITLLLRYMDILQTLQQIIRKCISHYEFGFLILSVSSSISSILFYQNWPIKSIKNYALLNTRLHLSDFPSVVSHLN